MECEFQVEVQELAHYKVIRMLGEGGFGQVFQAWDTRLERSVAIKRLKSALLSSRPGDLLEEARLAASLRHPAFVRIFSIEGDSGAQSIVMEYVEGSTLRQVAHGARLPLAQALGIVRQVAEAMQEAHAQGLVHGDLKPSNLMLEAAGAVRILDFGLASKVDPLATQSVALDHAEGTIAYLAPELLLGSRQNVQSDIYALGVVLYELLTSERPFSHLGGLALAAAHIQSSSDQWQFPSDTGAGLAALVRAMTARDLGKRLASMEAVRDAVLQVQAAPEAQWPAQVAAPAPAKAAVWRAPAGRLAWAAGFTVLLAAGASGVALYGERLERYSPLFSESAAMQDGLAALKTFERDESLDAAIRRFNLVLERRPEHAAAAAGLAVAYSLRYAGDLHDEGWLRRADASAQLALKLNDQLALAHAGQGMVRMAQGRREEALALAERALRLDPRDLFALNLKGDVLTSMQRYPEAQRALEEAIRVYPGERVFQDLYGTLWYSQSKYKEAESAFRNSLRIEPDAVHAYSNLSATLLRLGREDEALQVLQRGLQVRPSGQLYSSLGTVLFNRGDYIGAAQAFERALSSSPGNRLAYMRWANLADTLRWIPGRVEASRDAYRQAVAALRPLIERAPSDASMVSRMGLYSARMGDAVTARSMSLRALELAPDSADVRFRAAVAYEISGDRAGALAELRNAQERGYPSNLISAEPDLMALRRDARFHQSTIGSVK